MKKIISLVLAAVMLLGMTTVLAQDIAVKDEGSKRAILVCYDNGKLVYSSLLKSEDGVFNINIPSQYDETNKKIYYIDTQEFKAVEDVISEETAAETDTPEATEAPAETAAPTATPKATATPKPSSSTTGSNSPYEKAAYGINAPALVVDVAESVNASDEEVYTVTVFYHGEEMTIPVNEDLQISTAPTEYAYMQGQTAGSLEVGDVISMTANVAGDKIKRIDFIFRPTDEDIATGDTDYGVNFEKLYTTGGSVAGQWAYLKYGEKASEARYRYAFGIVGERNGNSITLINKGENPDDAIDIDLSPNAYVYVCDVSGKEYDCEIGGIGDISGLPGKVMSRDTIVLDDSYTYNYALVRLVDDTATDVIVYSNYNN